LKPAPVSQTRLTHGRNTIGLLDREPDKSSTFFKGS